MLNVVALNIALIHGAATWATRVTMADIYAWAIRATTKVLVLGKDLSGTRALEHAARAWKAATAQACASERELIITATRIGLHDRWQAIFAPKGKNAYSLLRLMRRGASISHEAAIAQLAPVQHTIGAIPAITYVLPFRKCTPYNLQHMELPGCWHRCLKSCAWWGGTWGGALLSRNLKPFQN
jgi:hypothetical protein